MINHNAKPRIRVGVNILLCVSFSNLAKDTGKPKSVWSAHFLNASVLFKHQPCSLNNDQANARSSVAVLFQFLNYN